MLVWTSLLATVHLAMGIVWLSFYAWLVAHVRTAVERPRARRAVEWVTGAAMLGLGFRVAREAA